MLQERREEAGGSHFVGVPEKACVCFMCVCVCVCVCVLFPGGSEVKVSACNAEDLGLIPGS